MSLSRFMVWRMSCNLWHPQVPWLLRKSTLQGVIPSINWLPYALRFKGENLFYARQATIASIASCSYLEALSWKITYASSEGLVWVVTLLFRRRRDAPIWWELFERRRPVTTQGNVGLLVYGICYSLCLIVICYQFISWGQLDFEDM
jgi:hypothetical protein